MKKKEVVRYGKVKVTNADPLIYKNYFKPRLFSISSHLSCTHNGLVFKLIKVRTVEIIYFIKVIAFINSSKSKNDLFILKDFFRNFSYS